MQERAVRQCLQTLTTLGLAFSMSAVGAETPDHPAGFYIRGDVGAASQRYITFSDVNPSAANCDLCGDRFPTSLRDSFIFDVGVGSRLTPIFRVDFTLGYLPPAGITGQSTAPAASTGSANLDSVIGLLNAYVDFPSHYLNGFGKLQPYLTAGIGFARNHLGTTTGNSALIGPFTLSGAVATNLAWDIGAGLSFELTPQMTLDIEYRYLDRGEVSDGGTLSIGGPSIQLTPSRTGDLYSHVGTIGLRYGF